jgi:hypothetical protein
MGLKPLAYIKSYADAEQEPKWFTTAPAKALPKAGEWMHQIKVIFAFLMLALSLYFIRPLLPELAMQILSLLLGLGFIVFAAYRLTASIHERNTGSCRRGYPVLSFYKTRRIHSPATGTDDRCRYRRDRKAF